MHSAVNFPESFAALHNTRCRLKATHPALASLYFFGLSGEDVYWPVPARLTVCGLPVALSVMVIVPGRLPVAVGVNVTLMVQLAPAATELPQVLVWAYCALAAMLVTLSAAVPVLVSVTVCAALVVFTI